MDASTLDAPAAGLRTSPDGAPRGAAPDAGPGWLVLRNCALGGDGPSIDLVLLHPRMGVALVDFAPKDTDAAGRLRRALNARRFPAIFGGHPPVARAVLPADRLPDLDRVLLAEFKTQPPLALAGGDAWVGTARAAVEAQGPAAVPAPPRAKRRRRAFPWRAAALAVLAGASVGALMATWVPPPGRGTGNAPRDAGPAAAAPGGGEATAPRTLAALPEPAEDAVAARDAAPRPGPAAAPAGGGLTEQDVLAALRSADPATGVGPATTATPQGAGNAATALTAAAETRPEPPPAVAAPAGGVAYRPQDAPPADKPRDEGAVAARPQPPPPAGAGANRAGPPSVLAAPVGALPNRPRHAPPAAAALPEAPSAAAGGGRCREILVRATTGRTLSDDDREYLRRGCQAARG